MARLGAIFTPAQRQTRSKKGIQKSKNHATSDEGDGHERGDEAEKSLRRRSVTGP